MCFSLESSSAAAIALLPVGAYCLGSAVRKNRHFLPLSLVPLAFAVQQAAEACVWYGLHHDDQILVSRATDVFLFFALAFWPFWVPFSLLFAERRRPARIFLGLAAAASLFWLGFYLVSIRDHELHPRIINHTIDYGLANLNGFHGTSQILSQLVYLAFIVGPLLLARTGGDERYWRICAGIVATLLVISDLVYWYAFASVWCFFAAVASLLLAFAFVRLPRPQRRNH